MDAKLFFKVPPPLDPAWLEYERTSAAKPRPNLTGYEALKARQKAYSQECKDLNARVLASRDMHLNEAIKIHDTVITSHHHNSARGRDPAVPVQEIPIRVYEPSSAFNMGLPDIDAENKITEEENRRPVVVYYHGGGLVNGDLDSEDLTCRRVCKSLSCIVYSVEYRLMPDFTADDAILDALKVLTYVAHIHKESKLIVMGSSSGAQLAATVAQKYVQCPSPSSTIKINGVLLRCPVTCEPSSVPENFKGRHHSNSPAFHTSLLSGPAVTKQNRPRTFDMPLEHGHLQGLPKHWIQVTTNDVLYGDGACYAQALKDVGVDVRVDVIEGWPHTFWLKAPLLERALQADEDSIEGCRWLLENECGEV